MKRTLVLVLFLAVLLGISSVWAATINVPGDQPTIQAAIDAVTTVDGDVIQVAAGTYTGAVNINKRVSIIGTGMMSGANQTVITGGNPAILISATGIEGYPILLKDLQVIGANGIRTNYSRVDYLTFENVWIKAQTPGSGEGFRVVYASAHKLYHWSVSGSIFDNFYDGVIVERNPGQTDACWLEDVTFTDTQIINNKRKGMYLETLNSATFTDVTIEHNGYEVPNTTLADQHAAGIDLNLKDGIYSNLVFNNVTFTNNGLTGKHGAAIMVKARGTGTDTGYASYPAYLSNVSFVNCTVTGNERGIRFGEPGKNNTGPTNVTITGCSIYNNRRAYTGTDGSVYGDVLNCAVSPSISMEGTTLASNQALWFVQSPGTIQAAINDAASGDVINVAAGTYTENVVVNKPLTLLGANANITYGPGRGPESKIQAATTQGTPISLGTTLGSDHVTINGFEVTAPNSNYGIYSGDPGPSYLNIIFNYVHDIGTIGGTSNVYAINYRCSSTANPSLSQTDINISYNYIENVYNTTTAAGSSAGIWMGQSPATGVFSNVVMEYNTIKHVQSRTGTVFGTDGANSSGINIGCGWRSTGYVDSPIIRYNTITDLTGNAVYGISLQGNTPGAIVNNNTFNNFTDLNGLQNTAGLCVFHNFYLGADQGTNNGTGISAHNNSFTNVAYGIANFMTNVVDGTQNWWGHASGPFDDDSVNPDPESDNPDGLGVKATGYVLYDPWYANDAMTILGSDMPVHNVTQDTYYNTIQAAIDAADDNNVIEVDGGVYNEALNIVNRTGITITGLGTRELTVLKPEIADMLPWNVFNNTTRRAAIRIVGSTNITIQGFVLDCDLVKNNGWQGVLYANSTGGVFEYNTFKNMYIDQAHYYDVMFYARALAPYTPSARATLTIQGNEFIDTGRVGIVTHDYLHSVIDLNTFYKTTHTFGYGMEIGSSSTAVITNNEIHGFDTPAVSDGSTSAGIYIENAFTWTEMTAIAKPVSITGNEIYGCQYGIVAGNEFPGYAGNVDIGLTFSTNNVHDNIDCGILLTDKDRSAGSSVTATLSGNTITSTLGTADACGILVYTYDYDDSPYPEVPDSDADISVVMTGNTISGYEYGLYVYDYSDYPDASLFNLSATGTNEFLNAKTAIYMGNVNWEVLPTITGNNFANNSPIHVDNSNDDPLQLDMNAILAGNTYDHSILVDQIIYANAAVLYVDALETLIKDDEEQNYSVVAQYIEDLRGFEVELVWPKAYFTEPTNFAYGPLFDDWLGTPLVVDRSTDTEWRYEVSGAYFGAPPGVTGFDVVMITVDISSLPDPTNAWVDPIYTQIGLPLVEVKLYDDLNGFHQIPVVATLQKDIIIDSYEPWMDPITEPSGLPLPTDPLGNVMPTTLTVNFEDNYNLDHIMYLIQPQADADPSTTGAFSAEVATLIDGLVWNNTTGTWEIPNNVLNDLTDGTYEIFFLVVDDAGNFDITDAWVFIIDTTAPTALTWVQCRTTPDADISVDLAWTYDTENPPATIQIWALDYAALTGAGAYPVYNDASFDVPLIENDINPYTGATTDLGWVKVAEIPVVTALTLNTTTWTVVPDMLRSYYYFTIYGEDSSGNVSPAPSGTFYRESISYWPGDVVAILGAVDSDDISPLSLAWGSTPTAGNWNANVNVGPAVNNERRSRRTPDEVINIEDLMMFAMNYENTDYDYYPRNLPESSPITIAMNATGTADLLTVTLMLDGNTGFVRGLNIPIAYGNGLQLVSVESGTAWPEGSLLLHTNADGVVELSAATLGEESVVEGNGLITTLSFAITGSNTSLELRHMIARDYDNREIEIVNNPTGNVDSDDLVNVVPEANYLGHNYPNPFNPSTTLQYGLKDAGSVRLSVFNSRGQLIRTLVNETKAPGTYQINWNGRDNNGRLASSGIYFFRMETSEGVKTAKGLMIK